MIVQIWLGACILHVFAQSALNRPASLGASFRAGLRPTGWLILTSLIVGFFAFIAALPSFIAFAMYAASVDSGQKASGVAWIIATLAIIASLTALIVIMTRLMFAGTITVMEDMGSIDAMRRSWQLTRGRFFQLFLRLAAVAIVACVLYALALIPAGIILLATHSVLATLLAAVGGALVVMLIGGPFFVYFSAVCYVDQRIREENFGYVLETAYAQAAGINPPASYGIGYPGH